VREFQEFWEFKKNSINLCKIKDLYIELQSFDFPKLKEIHIETHNNNREFIENILKEVEENRLHVKQVRDINWCRKNCTKAKKV